MSEPAAEPDRPYDQASMIERLSRSDAWGGADVERVDTHISALFLVGERVYKLKRAVKLPFVDFSTVAMRRAACDAEIAVNRRTAPDLYLGVRPVTADGRVGGAGEAVDWVVEMRRFDGDNLFDKLAAEGRLGDDLLEATVITIARFHAAAERRPDLWHPDHVRAVIDGIEQSYPSDPPAPVSGDAAALAVRRIRALAAQQAERIDARRAAGFVRDVHGDPHLRNIVLWRGAPTLFDAVEFDERIRCCDCVYDIAFLLMDMLHRDMPGAANRALNVYFRETGDIDGLALLPLFLGMRAAIRGHIAISAAQYATDPGPGLHDARAYIELAAQCMEEVAPVVVAIGGLSGTGKSTIARAVAPGFRGAAGALILRSDEIRKELAGVAPTDRLGSDYYTREWSEQVYAALAERCRRAVAAGWPVIADAVYGDAAHRTALCRVAAAAGVPFAGLWLEAPRDVAIERIDRRRNDASDADIQVAAAQSASPPSEPGWRTIAAGGTVARTVELARDALSGLVADRSGS